jgi:molybdenum cofactor cytidylyltransferase
MDLIKALRLIEPACVAFVGAGGKTTAIFRAAGELSTNNSSSPTKRTVLVTITTHFGAWQTKIADQTREINSSQDIRNIEKEILGGVVLLYSEMIGDRLGGLQPNLLEEVRQLAERQSIPLLIEADGARTRPLKAPGAHEPNIPEFVQLVVVVAGLSALGKPLTDKWVHRPEKFSELTGLHPGEIITADDLVMMLLSKEGGLKNIPPHARRIAILNQADIADLQSQAKAIGEKLMPVYQASITTSLSPEKKLLLAGGEPPSEKNNGIHAVIERTGGIILAAGSSSRFGEAKQLLEWKGEPLIRHVARTALKAGLSPVVVVVGSSAGEVIPVIKDLQVRIVNNQRWMDGMSTSLKVGLSEMPDDLGGVVFLQADQPQIPELLIKSLIEAHQVGLRPIIAPQIDGQRGNPVLFDVDTFSDLLSVEGDQGGRALFSRYPVEWVTWHDPKILLDIDSPDDFKTFLQRYPEGEEKI